MSEDKVDTGTLLTRRKFALGIAFAAAAGVAAARQPSKNVDYLGKNKLDQLLPEQLGDWKFVSSSGLVVPPEDQLARAIYSQLLTRVYADENGSHIMLLVAQSASQTGILQIHRPEFCYTAGGYRLSQTEQHVVKLPWGRLPTQSISATREGETEQLVYWTRIGEHLPKNWPEQRMAVAIDNLRGLIPDAVMVRVSIVNSNKAAALATIDQFVNTLMGSVAPQMRRVLGS